MVTFGGDLKYDADKLRTPIGDGVATSLAMEWQPGCRRGVPPNGVDAADAARREVDVVPLCDNAPPPAFDRPRHRPRVLVLDADSVGNEVARVAIGVYGNACPITAHGMRLIRGRKGLNTGSSKSVVRMFWRRTRSAALVALATSFTRSMP